MNYEIRPFKFLFTTSQIRVCNILYYARCENLFGRVLQLDKEEMIWQMESLQRR